MATRSAWCLALAGLAGVAAATLPAVPASATSAPLPFLKVVSLSIKRCSVDVACTRQAGYKVTLTALAGSACWQLKPVILRAKHTFDVAVRAVRPASCTTAVPTLKTVTFDVPASAGAFRR